MVLSFRFAAADGVPAARRPRALSLVMAGGVFAGVIGPQLVTHTMDLWAPNLFAVTFLAQAGVAALCALVLLGVRLPRRATPEAAAPSLGARIKAALFDSRTWGSMLYFLLELPLGVFYFSLFTTLLALGISLLLAPWAQWLAGIPIVIAGHREIWLPFWAAPLASLAGILLLLVTMHLARGLGRVQAALAERMLVRA